MAPGTVHLPGWVDSERVKQLVAKLLVTVKTKRGFQKLEWQKLRDRNEPWTAGSTPVPPHGSPAPPRPTGCSG
jgi:hypothetical protein